MKLTTEQKHNLALRVFKHFYQETESWKSEDHLGADIAYLTWAILDDSSFDASIGNHLAFLTILKLDLNLYDELVDRGYLKVKP